MIEQALRAAQGADLADAVALLREAAFRRTPVRRRVRQALLPCLYSQVPWLDDASLVARQISVASAGSHSVYVVLLMRPTAGGSHGFGLYVGQTARSPSDRLVSHLRGTASSRHVRRWGVCLLPAIYEHLNPVSEPESRRVEAALADRLREAGLWVEGGH